MTLSQIVAWIGGAKEDSKKKDDKIAALEGELATIKAALPAPAAKAEGEDKKDEEKDKGDKGKAKSSDGKDKEKEAEPENKGASDIAQTIAALVEDNRKLVAKVAGLEQKAATTPQKVNAEAARLVAANGHAAVSTINSNSEQTAKVITRAEFDAMNQAARSEFFKSGGKISG